MFHYEALFCSRMTFLPASQSSESLSAYCVFSRSELYSAVPGHAASKHPFKTEGSLSKEEPQTGAGSQQLTFQISSPGCSATSSLSSNPKAFFKLVLHLLLQPVMQPAASLLASELVSKSCVCSFFSPPARLPKTRLLHTCAATSIQVIRLCSVTTPGFHRDR